MKCILTTPLPPPPDEPGPLWHTFPIVPMARRKWEGKLLKIKPPTPSDSPSSSVSPASPQSVHMCVHMHYVCCECMMEIILCVVVCMCVMDIVWLGAHIVIIVCNTHACENFIPVPPFGMALLGG